MDPIQQYEQQLLEDIGAFVHDPLGYVVYSFPWGEGELAAHKGPRPWQAEYLRYVGECLQAGDRVAQAMAKAAELGLDQDPDEQAGKPIQTAVSSGHGIGKSALVSWVIMWGISTFEDTRGVVTANTEPQLKLKTWAELAKWHRLAINSHWFNFTATSIYSADAKHEKTWRIDMVPWSESRPESFAGLHNQGKRVVLIFDEASAIPDKIWEVSEGAMTDADTEIIWAVFGNPTRNTGRFRECFGSKKHRWRGWTIDSRTVAGTNKSLFDEWVADWGEDSDFVRVRVRGLFPRGSSLQFIDNDIVGTARRREAVPILGDPLIMALDVARGGDDECVFYFRRGMDARTITPIRIPGSEVRDSMRLVAKAVELIGEHKPDYFFFDETGVGGPVGDRIRQLGHVVMGVQFGSSSPDAKYANMRAYIWGKCKEALFAGLAIFDSNDLEQDLCGVEFSHNSRDQIQLESKESMKKRGLGSPDMGDGLCMTFAYKVAPKSGPGSVKGGKQGQLAHDYDPFSDERMNA